MKTYLQFFEDLDQRKAELRQRQLDQMAANREKIIAYQEAQREKKMAEIEKKRLKDELRQELQQSKQANF